MSSPAEIKSSDSVSSVDDRLEHLAHSISRDVLPGIERELTKVRGWLAMLDGRPDESVTSVKEKMLVKQKYETINTAIHVFKAALGPNYRAPTKPGPFQGLFAGTGGKEA